MSTEENLEDKSYIFNGDFEVVRKVGMKREKLGFIFCLL